MQSPQVQPAPCPKCGGVRFLSDGSSFGITHSPSCSALYCTGCGYVEFYASKHLLENLAQERADAAARVAEQQAKQSRS